jgi:hypothetical protein
MNRKAAVIIGLQTLIIVILFWVLVFFGRDEYEAATDKQDDNIASTSHVGTENGAATVTLSPQSQQQSGITTTMLTGASHRAAVSSFGTVMPIDSLVELRTRYLAARAEADIARAAIANSRQEYQRLAQLNRDNRNVSDRAVAAAEAAWRSDEARLKAADTAASSLRDSIRQQWGDTLTGWATQTAAGESLQRLLLQHELLVQVALPFDAAAPAADTPLLVAPIGAQGRTVAATFVSASPQTDATLQGKTYFYRAPVANLRAGMRVTAQLAAQGKSATGVIVPQAAVVWYANSAWVYRKIAADKFVRQRISTDTEAGDGWFNSAGVKAGDEVITSGAQLLLSEEFKYQIKNENDD